MSLSKKINITVTGYTTKLSSELNFYQGDSIKLIISLNEFGVDLATNRSRVMPINPLVATLLIDNPTVKDCIESAEINENEVVFELSKKHTQHIGKTKVMIVLNDDDGCEITIPEFQFEVRERLNIEGVGTFAITDTTEVDNSIIATAFLDSDEWKTGELISSQKLNKMVDTIKKHDVEVAKIDEISSSLENKANKNEVNSKVWSMANMGQDIKEAMTGGSVAVVGKNSVLAENIVNGQVQPSKLSNVTVGKNKFNKNAVTYGCYYDGDTGVITQGASSTGLNCISEVIPCEVGKTYYRNKQSNVIYWNSAMEYAGREPVGTGEFTPHENSCYMSFSFIRDSVDEFQVHEGSEYSSYEPYGVICNDYFVYGTDIVDVYWYESDRLSFVTGSDNSITMQIKGSTREIGGLYILFSNKSLLKHLFVEDTEFKIPHSKGLVYNIFSKTFDIRGIGTDDTNYINAKTGEILLLGNLKGRAHCGYLYKEYRYVLDNSIIHDNYLNVVDVYCRHNQYLKIKTDNKTITFTMDLSSYNTWSVYKLDKNGKYTKYSANSNWVEVKEGTTLTELVYTLSHNDMLILDTLNNKIKVENMISDSIDYYNEKAILLALNIDGKIVAGELKEDFNGILMQQEAKEVTNKKCNIGKFKFKFDVALPSSYMSSHSLVDDELWIFPVSNDEGTNTATCVRYRVDFENNNAELVGSFTHNWGHVNSSSYSPLTDSIICGNGSGSYDLMGQIFIFENARSFRDRSNVNRNEAIIIDVQEFGYKCNVVWGEANGGKGNICYVVSNDNQNIRKLLLGQGANKFEKGVFLEGKTGLQFNGTYKILGKWTMPRIDVNQGTNYENGALYIGLGHDTIWFTKNSLQDDGTVSYETYKEYRYDDEGGYIYKNMQGITVTDKYIIVGQDSGTHEILVYYK